MSESNSVGDDPAYELSFGPLRLTPQFRDYVWGGRRLRPQAERTAEAWVVYEQDRVAEGPFKGHSLSELADHFGAQLVGRRVITRTGKRFPILVKLLDCAAWLSIQVHPNDQQAEQLAGPGHFGKTEAWYIVEAAPDARIIAGVRPGTTREALRAAILSGRILDCAQYYPVRAGDTIFMPAGTIHALGPGLLIYEVQQTSDITYRVWDWDRPASEGRKLHIDESIAVVDPAARSVVTHVEERNPIETLVDSPFFSLKLLSPNESGLSLYPKRETFHALTTIEGEAQVASGEVTVAIRKFDSVIIPAASGEYNVYSQPGTRVLLAGIGN